jgi:hypothetical protein
MPHPVAPAGTGITINTGDGAQVFSAAETIALLTLLADHGYSEGHPGEDEESQQFAADVLELNPDWQPGEIPRVPTGYGSVPDELRSPRAWRQPRRAPIVHIPQPRENQARPREHRARRIRSARTSARGDPDEPPPALAGYPESTPEPAPGILSERSLAAYLSYMGVGSLEELEEEQLKLDVDPPVRRRAS